MPDVRATRQKGWVKDTNQDRDPVQSWAGLRRTFDKMLACGYLVPNTEKLSMA